MLVTDFSRRRKRKKNGEGNKKYGQSEEEMFKKIREELEKEKRETY